MSSQMAALLPLPLLLLLLLLVVSIGSLPLAAAPPVVAAPEPPPWQDCIPENGNYTVPSPYQTNIEEVSDSIAHNIGLSANLFVTGSYGTLPDVVHAIALCRGDVNASTCRSCVAKAFVDAQELCPYNRDATVYYYQCYVRFSNRNISATTSNENVLFHMYNFTTTVLPWPEQIFDAAVRLLLNRTVGLVFNSSRLYATGAVAIGTGDEKGRVYSLVQCTPDISPANCVSCLSELIQMNGYYSRVQNGTIQGTRCVLSYEFAVAPFFTGRPMLQLPAMAAAPSSPPRSSPMLQVPAMAAVPSSPPRRSKGNKPGKILAIALPIVAAVLTLGTLCFCIWRRKRKTPIKPLLPHTTNIPEDILSIDSLIIDLSTLRAATENFDEGNKLGEGGFGAVYKGVLPGDQEIAVKRLSESSRQGIEELKNELVLVAKLQHKNLVRLLGVCLEDHERLLVYEYMPNKSLDTILFESEKRSELDWGKRFKVVNGIARGLQYLHEDSRVKIIHRDLKASNVLLDYDYNPKISDFGLARLFGSDQTQDVTNRVVGTYGYMAPEYAMRGHYSIKSDVFSFGVLMLEIVTGRRKGGSYRSEDESADLLSLVWEHWTTGTLMEIMDSSLSSLAPRDQMLKCVHIGLLCVQDDPVDRPTMSMVNIMLSSSTVTLQAPSRPAFCIRKYGTNSDMYSEVYGASQSASRSPLSLNDVSITELEPR